MNWPVISLDVLSSPRPCDRSRRRSRTAALRDGHTAGARVGAGPSPLTARAGESTLRDARAARTATDGQLVGARERVADHKAEPRKRARMARRAHPA